MARCRWSCWAQKWILSENLVLFVNAINTRTYTQIHTPTVVQGGGGEVDKTPPHHFMGSGAAGGLSRHQQWSTSWIMPRIRNPVKTARNWYFFGARTFKIIHKKHFVSFYPPHLLLLLKDVEKTCIFTQKWLDHLLLTTSYLVTVVADYH